MKEKRSPAAPPERHRRQGPLYNTVRTPTDKSVWGINKTKINSYLLSWNKLKTIVLSSPVQAQQLLDSF